MLEDYYITECFMAYQSEAELENLLIEQLKNQGYESANIQNYEELEANFKEQFARFNAAKLDKPLTDKEWERVLNHLLGKSVFQSAKILRDKFILECDDGKKIYLSLLDEDHTKNIFQVTHQTTVVGKYVNRYDVTLLVNGLPLVQIELKRRGVDIKEAVNQVMRYKKHSYNGLYHFIQTFVVSNGVDTNYFANSDKELLYSLAFFWTDENNISNHMAKTRNGQYTAIFAVSSIPMLIKYYDIFKKIDHKLTISGIFSYGQNEDAEGKDEHSRDALERIINDYNQTFSTNFSTDTFHAYHKDISDRVKGKKTKSLDILLVVNMFLTGFDSKPLSVLYVDKDLRYHDLLQAYSRTNRVEKETKPFGIIICYRNLKKNTDDAIALFSQGQNDGVLTPGYEYFVNKYNEVVLKIRDIALEPSAIDTLQDENEQRKFVELFRELTKYLNSLRTFIEFSIDSEALLMRDQEYQDYKSKYLMLYHKTITEKEVVSVLNDVDFCIELMESNRINVAYIMNLIRNIHFDDPKQKSYDIKQIEDELDRTDNPLLLRKVELLRSFLDQVVKGLSNGDEIDAAYNDFENAEKNKEIQEFAQKEDVDAQILTDVISEFEFSGVINTGGIRDRIKTPMPLLKKRALVSRIVNFIKNLAEKFQ